jgi:predicted dehydrogenase
MINFAAVGLDHRHIFEQVGRLVQLGARCVGYWTEGNPGSLSGFNKLFPDVPRVENSATLFDDPDIQLIVTAAIPQDRADIAIRAMAAGKDVMSDKPGVTTMVDLERIREATRKYDRIWSVNFSERFEVPAVQKAVELVAAGAIGRVVQTLGTGPHRLNKAMRPDWFFDKNAYGGVLVDIASHQIDQFLIFTGSEDAEVVSSTVANYNNHETPGLQDFGELVLRSDSGHGYIRVDWFTPDGLPTWGDGRLQILGTQGYMELRKYVDIGGRDGTDHLYLVNGDKPEYIDCSTTDRPYYAQLVNDIQHRTETAMPQTHCFKVMELAIRAQEQAVDLGLR